MLSGELLQFVQVFVLVVFRIAGMMVFTPFFGSARVPRQVKILMCVILAGGMVGGVDRPADLPDNTWQLAVGIGGELMFGVAMGMILSFSFIAAQWAGEMIGQQMGLDIGAVFDPQFGQGGSIIGEMYFMLTLVVFLVLNGHHAVLIGLQESFQALPLLSVGINAGVLELLVGLLMGATNLAIRLAAPMLLTMLVADMALGLLSKTMPQMNLMTAGLTLRSVIGMIVLIIGLALSGQVMEDAMLECLETFRDACGGGAGGQLT